jgi:hypothetical protein
LVLRNAAALAVGTRYRLAGAAVPWRIDVSSATLDDGAWHWPRLNDDCVIAVGTAYRHAGRAAHRSPHWAADDRASDRCPYADPDRAVAVGQRHHQTALSASCK